MKTPSCLFNFIVALFISLTPCLARAYFVASLTGSHVDLVKPTHVLVSGRGQDLGRQPQMSALGVAARIRVADPGAQVVLLSVFEDATNRADLEAKGIEILKVDDTKPFNTSSAMSELLKFKSISSLQFFGHNSPTLGTQTDGPGERFDFREGQVRKLRGHFGADGYVFIHGCNAGWIIAPLLSTSLGVPTAGAFTGTHFERLHSDSNFYVADDTRAPTAAWAKANEGSFLAARACSNGGCLRMRPDNVAYNGHWGDFSGGALGFYKFFCATNTQAQCDRVMAKALANFLTTENLDARTSRAAFIEAAKDFICPSSKDRAISNACQDALDQALAGKLTAFSSLRSPAVQCDFKSCAAKFTCTTEGGAAGLGACSVERLKTKQSTTQVDEFLAYVRGYDQLFVSSAF